MLLAPQTHGAVESQLLPRARTEHRSSPSSPFPPVDAHIVTPEVTYDEIIRGRKVSAMTALYPHAKAQNELAFLIAPHVKSGYVALTELLTRAAVGSDFGTDVCVCREGTDPETDSRYLEEISFEVVNEQSMRDVTEKAEDLILRGVRRVFGLFVKTGKVCEWSKAEDKFVPMNKDGVIEDPLFVRPIAVKALVDFALCEDEVARALIVKNNAAIVAFKQHAHTLGVDEGVLKGRRDALIDQLGERFGDVPTEVHGRIHAASIDQLRGWSKKLLTVASIDDVFAADAS